MKKEIIAKVAEMKVVEMRKVAGQYGIKNASKFKREVLEQMLIDAMYEDAKAKAKAEKKAAKKAADKSDKRYKAAKVESDQVESQADYIIGAITMEGFEKVDLFNANRKVLIVVMKKLHCTRWYRTYDKPTMINKIKEAMVAA